MKKTVSLLVTLMLIVVMVTACGSNNNAVNAPQGSEEKAAEKVKVSLWVLDSHTFIEEIVTDFENENANVDVEVVKYGVDPIKEALKIAANSKTLPDIWFTWGGSLGSFYPDNGLTMDLTQLSKDDDWSNRYIQAAIDLSTFDGKVSGFPFHLNVMGMWYSKKIYEELNLTPPTTFAEFESQLQPMKDKGYVPMSFGGKGGWHIMRLVEQLLEHSAGSELHDKLNGLSASWNDPAVVEAFTKLKEYSDKGYFPKGHVAIDQTEAVSHFYPHKAGLVIEGPWLDARINGEGLDPNEYGVFAFPSEQSPTRPSVFAEMFQVNADLTGAKKDAVLKLGAYMTNVDVVNKYIDKYGTPAVLNAEFTESTPNINELLGFGSEGGFLITDQALPQEVAQKLFEAQDKVVLNEWTPQQAAEAMDKAVNDYKAKSQ